MVPFVVLLGGIATLVGVVAIAFGVPINEFGLGNTLTSQARRRLRPGSSCSRSRPSCVRSNAATTE